MIPGARPWTTLDVAIIASLTAIALQLLPLPFGLRDLLSPHAADVDRTLRIDAAWAAAAGERAAAPLTINVNATLQSLAKALLVALAFWSARGLFERGGVRRIAHRIAWIGLVVSVVAIVERTTSPTALYGVWPVAGARPYGPFINRNHMATWLIIAIPLTAGAFAMRVRQTIAESRNRRSAALDGFADPTLLWLAASAAIMLVALVVSASRSGAIGIAAGLGAGSALAASRLGRGERRWVVIAPAVACVAVVWYAGAAPLADRFVHVAASSSVDRRVEIWRQTLPIVRDFAVTGTGAGTYYTAMLVYQGGDRLFFFNQAHNHYLQIAAEGGILAGVPRALMLVAFAVIAWRRLRADRSEMFWLRAGALASMVAVAAQSMWETGLVMPANAALCAVVAAIAVHRPRSLRIEDCGLRID